MTPYLLTLSSKTKGQKRFLDSLSNITVEHIAIQFKPFDERLDPFTYRHYDFKYPGHIDKYKYVPRDLDRSRYLIFSDTDDVVFQKELPEFSKPQLACENLTFKDTIYRDKDIKDWLVYNSGLYAMRVSLFYKWVDYLLENAKGRLSQPTFNRFIREHVEDFDDSLEVFCPLFANIHQGVSKKDGVWKDGVWKTDEKTISVIHGNGWTKKLL
jgi:hypothetical protein